MARIRKSLPDDIRRETKFFIEPFLNKEDGLLYYIDTRGFLVPIAQGDGSIYTSDGTLTGDRTLTGAANFLHFNSLSNFTVGTTGAINLNPGTAVAIGDDKGITVDNPTGGIVALSVRSNPINNITWKSTGVGLPPTLLAMSGVAGTELNNGSGNCEIWNNLAIMSGTGNDVADIDAGLAKTLVTKEWVTASATSFGIYGGSGSIPASATTTVTLTAGSALDFDGITTPSIFSIGKTGVLRDSVGFGGESSSAKVLIAATNSAQISSLQVQMENTTGINTGVNVYSTGIGGTTNIGAQLRATGATNNYALIVDAGDGLTGFGTNAPAETAIVEMVSTTQGLLIPRWTGAQQTTNTTLWGVGEAGMTWFNSDTKQFMGWSGTVSVILG